MQLPRIFGGKPQTEEAPKTPEQSTTEAAKGECAHMILHLRWDRVEDMGDDSKAVGYRCDACGTLFSMEQGEAIQAEHGSRTV